jgi:hypothetical protein
MPCTEIKNKKYQTRKSPPFHAGHCKDLTKKGKDGDYLSKPDSNGTYKWIKVNKTRKTAKGAKGAKGAKVYFIHSNGARPFRVEVSGKNVEIYHGSPAKLPDGTPDYDRMEYTDLVKKLTVKEIYVGQSPCIPAADACGAFAKGNTLLLHITGNTYVYVGETIYEFKMDDEVDTYYSLIGNNDSPYPVLLGTKNVYFMLDHQMMPREVFKAKMTDAEWADAYQYFFGFKDFETGEKIKCDEKDLKRRKECIKARGEKIKAISKRHVKKMKGVTFFHGRV